MTGMPPVPTVTVKQMGVVTSGEKEAMTTHAPNPLSIGRASTFLVGPHDPLLNRQVCDIYWHKGSWEIENSSSSLEIKILRRGDAHAMTHLGPGATCPLPEGASRLMFHTATAEYEIGVSCTLVGQQASRSQRADDAPATQQRTAFTPEQEELLRYLAEIIEDDPAKGDAAVPNVSEIAKDLGWTDKKVNRKLDTIVELLRSYGEVMGKPYKNSVALWAYKRPGSF